MDGDEAEQVARFPELSPTQRAMLLSARSSPLSRQSDLPPNPPKTPKSPKHAVPGPMTSTKGPRFQAEDSHAWQLTGSSLLFFETKKGVILFIPLIADAGDESRKRTKLIKTKGYELRIVKRRKRAFEVVGLTWSVERTFAWIRRYRRMSKDYEPRVQTSETLIDLMAIRLMLQRIRLVRLVGALLIACLALNAKGANLVGQELKNGGAEPEYYQVPNDHAAVHRAVIEARKTVEEFITALQHPVPGQQDFEVKKPFIQGNEVEHIWLSDVRFVGNRFQGQVDNKPEKIRGLKLGQLVSVNPNEISDWLYVDNGKLVGGYTVRAHYNELSPEQKQEFNRAADFKIGKQ